ncbi:hypothetical protein AOLI_G00286150 [Acnodon oligacanthus]
MNDSPQAGHSFGVEEMNSWGVSICRPSYLNCTRWAIPLLEMSQKPCGHHRSDAITGLMNDPVLTAIVAHWWPASDPSHVTGPSTDSHNPHLSSGDNGRANGVD